MSRLVTVKELAEILHVPASWIYQQTHLGPQAIPFVKVGKYVRFDPDEVVDFYRKKGGLPVRLPVRDEAPKPVAEEQGETIVFENGLKGRLSVEGKGTEKLGVWEIVVSGKKFLCLEKETSVFGEYLAGINDQEVDLTFLHSMQIRCDQPRQRRGKPRSSKDMTSREQRGTAYHCTIRVPKWLARKVFLDRQERADRFIQIFAQAAVKLWKEESGQERRETPAAARTAQPS